MIRNVKDVTGLFDRRFGAAMARPLSLVRTLVWALAGIYLLGLAVPAPSVHFAHSRALASTSVTDVMLNKNDPRGWQHPPKDPHAFTIAWIGGSTIQTVKPGAPGFLPADVVNRLPTVNGRPVQVNMYLMDASRIFDLYAAVADAISTKPDLIVLDVNPLWVFNPNAVQEWDNLDQAALPNLVPDIGSWPLTGALYSPSDLALSIASGHLSAIRDRWSYSQKLLADVNRLAPQSAPPAAPVSGQPRPSGVKLITAMAMPYTFWNYYRLSPQDTVGKKGYPAILRQSQTDGSTMNDDIVKQMLSALGDAKIPTIAYVSAVDPRTLDAPTDAALHRVEDHLRQVAAEYPARTLYVQWQSGTRLVQGLQFRDMGHMTYDAPMANLLASTICTHLTAIDPQTECTATSRTEP